MSALLATAAVLVAAVVVTVVYETVRAVLAPDPASVRSPARPVGSGTSAARPKVANPSTAAVQGGTARQPGLHHPPTDVRSSPRGENGVLAHWTSPGPPVGCEVHGPGQTASHPVPSARRPSTD